MTLWTFAELVAAVNGTPFLPGTRPLPDIEGISIDTRTLAPGEAYFAIKGDVHDGHDFVDAAREAGAACAVVGRDRAKAAGDMPIVIVDDTLRALESLGRAARARSDALVIAVTGSVGKTTTKELLRTVLAPSGEVHAAVASFNNHWGVPLTLARLPRTARYAVIEIGMNHPGEITPLVAMAQPHVAIVTLVAGAHLGAFASVDEIAEAKAEIFSGVVPKGAALVNSNDPRVRLLAKRARDAGIERIVSFGERGGPRPDVVLEAFDGSTARYTIAGRTLEAKLGAPGHHMAMNAAAALGAAFLVGADLDAAAEALAGFEAGKGRGERLRIARPEGALLVIDESYNANPASMRAALAALGAEVPEGAGRRIAVLGDMLEMGDHAQAVHEELAEPVLEAEIDAVYLVGPEMDALARRLRSATGQPGARPLLVRHFDATPELATIIADEVRGQDVVMLKSSLGLRFATLVEALHRPAA